MLNKYRLQVFSLIRGAIAGFLLFHPYAMFISSTMHAHQNEGTRLHLKGLFSIILDLEPGREYQFRYLIDDSKWENDWNADKYVGSHYGDCDNSVVIV